MADLRQFRPTLYLLLAMGITGFAISAQAPGLWLFAMAGMGINAWLVKTGRFVPLPRLLAAAATLLALGEGILEVRWGATTPILTIGKFLVLLHLVKLYEQRANRDYAQMLVLSLLLMAAAAISTASLVFGMLLMAYLFVSLYCCLLFHLKVESDHAMALLAEAIPAGTEAAAIAAERIDPTTLRQDQRRLSASMRLLTGLVAAVSLTTAVVVFLFFPRGAVDGIFGHRLWSPPQVLTGFNDQVTLGQVARIGQSEEVVALVKVSKDGQPWGGTEALMLRGTTLDEYSGGGMSEERGARPGPWQWRRSVSNIGTFSFKAGGGVTSTIPYSPWTTALFSQEVTLELAGSTVVFGMAGEHTITPTEDLRLQYWLRDGVLTTSAESPLSMAHYVVESTGRAPVETEALGVNSRRDPRLVAFARQPEVSGTDGSGRPLWSLRGTVGAPADVDHRIAAAMERYLRTHYQYTLDLTDVADEMADDDPLVTFLTKVKRGHCEYFAGAMTLMCQSLGLPARMVVGYRCDEFNGVGQFYIVRQSQAHAWVEVLTGRGDERKWETFDPTSGQQAVRPQTAGFFGQLKSLFNYMEYRWGVSVVAYGQQNRQAIMDAMDQAISHDAVKSSQSLQKVPRFLDHLSEIIANPTRISAVIMVTIVGLIFAVAYYLIEKLRMHRRAGRIGIGGLPAAQQRKLARQLGFYDDLLRLLERHGIAARPNLTPMEFSDHLTDLPQEIYHDVRRLTRLFYRVRYGQAELSARQRRRVDGTIARIGRNI